MKQLKKFKLILFVIMINVQTSWSQSNTEQENKYTKWLKEPKKFGMVSHIGYHKINTNAINKVLISNGYPSLDNNTLFSYGLSLQGFLGEKFFTEIEGNLFAPAHSGFTGNPRGYCLILSFGYTVISSDKFRLYPIAGLGSSNVKILTYKNSNHWVSFDTAVSNAEHLILNAGNQFFDIGLGADIKINKKRISNECTKYHTTIGIRAGYRFDGYNSAWSPPYPIEDVFGGTLGPPFSFAGPYIQITIGDIIEPLK